MADQNDNKPPGNEFDLGWDDAEPAPATSGPKVPRVPPPPQQRPLYQPPTADEIARMRNRGKADERAPNRETERPAPADGAPSGDQEIDELLSGIELDLEARAEASRPAMPQQPPPPLPRPPVPPPGRMPPRPPMPRPGPMLRRPGMPPAHDRLDADFEAMERDLAALGGAADAGAPTPVPPAATAPSSTNTTPLPPRGPIDARKPVFDQAPTLDEIDAVLGVLEQPEVARPTAPPAAEARVERPTAPPSENVPDTSGSPTRPPPPDVAAVLDAARGSEPPATLEPAAAIAPPSIAEVPRRPSNEPRIVSSRPMSIPPDEIDVILGISEAPPPIAESGEDDALRALDADLDRALRQGAAPPPPLPVTSDPMLDALDRELGLVDEGGLFLDDDGDLPPAIEEEAQRPSAPRLSSVRPNSTAVREATVEAAASLGFVMPASLVSALSLEPPPPSGAPPRASFVPQAPAAPADDGFEDGPSESATRVVDLEAPVTAARVESVSPPGPATESAEDDADESTRIVDASDEAARLATATEAATRVVDVASIVPDPPAARPADGDDDGFDDSITMMADLESPRSERPPATAGASVGAPSGVVVDGGAATAAATTNPSEVNPAATNPSAAAVVPPPRAEKTEDRGAQAARRTVRARKPRVEVLPLVGRTRDATRSRIALMEQLAEESSDERAKHRAWLTASELAAELGEEDEAADFLARALASTASDAHTARVARRRAVGLRDTAAQRTQLAAEASRDRDPAERSLVFAAAVTHGADVPAASDLDHEVVAALVQAPPDAAPAALERLADAWLDRRARGRILLHLAASASPEAQGPFLEKAAEVLEQLGDGTDESTAALRVAFGLIGGGRADGDARARMLNDIATLADGDELGEAAQYWSLAAQGSPDKAHRASRIALLRLCARRANETRDGEREVEASTWLSQRSRDGAALVFAARAGTVALERGDIDVAEALLRDARGIQRDAGVTRALFDELMMRDPSRRSSFEERSSGLEGLAAAALGGDLAAELDAYAKAEKDGEDVALLDALRVDLGPEPDALDEDWARAPLVASLAREQDRDPSAGRSLALFAASVGDERRAAARRAETSLRSGTTALARTVAEYMGSREELDAAYRVLTERLPVDAAHVVALLHAGAVEPDAREKLLRDLLADRRLTASAALSLADALRGKPESDPSVLAAELERAATAAPGDEALLARAEALRVLARGDDTVAVARLADELMSEGSDLVVRELLRRAGRDVEAAGDRSRSHEKAIQRAPKTAAERAEVRESVEGSSIVATRVIELELEKSALGDDTGADAGDDTALPPSTEARQAERLRASLERRLATTGPIAHDVAWETLEASPSELDDALRARWAERAVTAGPLAAAPLAAALSPLASSASESLDRATFAHLALLVGGADAALRDPSRVELDLWLARRFAGRSDRDERRRGAVALVEKLASPLERAAAALSASEYFDEGVARAAFLEPFLDRAETHPTLAATLAADRVASEDRAGAAAALVLASKASRVPARGVELALRATGIYDELGDDDGVIAALEQASHADPQHPDAYEALKARLDERGDKVRLADLLARRLEASGATVSPEELVTLYGEQAKLREEAGDKEGARRALRKLLERKADDRDAIRAVARLSRELGDHRAAAEAFVSVAKFCPDEADQRWAFFSLGEIYDEHLPDPRRAEAAWRRVLRSAPQDRAALVRLARLQRREKNYPAAIETLETLVGLGGDDQGAQRLELASTLEESGETRRAEQTLEAARKASPTSLPILRALTEHYKKLRADSALVVHLSRAAQDYRQALAEDPGDEGAWLGLVEVLGWRGRDEGARIVAGAARALGVVDAEIERLGAGIGSVGDALAGRTIEDRVAPSQLGASARDLFRELAPFLEKLHPLDLRALKAERAGAKDEAARALAQRLATYFGLTDIELHIAPPGVRACMAQTTPAAIVVGRDYLTLPEAELAFLFARAIGLARAGLGVVVRANPRDVAFAVTGLGAQFDPSVGERGADSAPIAEQGKKLIRLLSRKQVDDLAPRAAEVAGAPDFDARTLAGFATDVANRLALLATGPFEPAMRALLKLGGVPIASGDLASNALMIVRSPEAESLLRFTISDTHFDARTRRGRP